MCARPPLHVLTLSHSHTCTSSNMWRPEDSFPGSVIVQPRAPRDRTQIVRLGSVTLWASFYPSEEELPFRGTTIVFWKGLRIQGSLSGVIFYSFWIINSVWCSVRQDLLFKVGIMYSSFMLNCPLNDIFVWLSFVGFCFVLCLWDRVSCGPGWTWTLCVMKAGLLLLSLPSEPGASQACATTSGSIEISVRALCSLSSSSPPLYDVPLPVITPAASGDLCS